MNPPSATDEKAQTILQAVRTVLGQKGYAGTTIKQVAAEAGVSRGLLHYYFKNKEEMVARVARQTVEDSARLAESIFGQCRPGDDLAAVLVGGFRQMVQASPDFYNVFFESWAVARQSEMVYRELGTLYQEFRLAILRGLEDVVTRGVISPAIPLAGLAAVLTSLFDGLGLQLMTEPELMADHELWKATEAGVRALLAGVGGGVSH